MHNSRSNRFPVALWGAIIGIFLLFLLSRLYHLLALPPFIDEHEVITYAQDVYRGQFLVGAGNSRLLLGWYASLFQMTGSAMLWITRAITAMAAMLNVAVIYNLGQRWASRWAGLIGAALYILSPYVFFHDRLGLSDTFATTFGFLSLWFAVRFTARKRPLDGVLSGFLITLAILAKATGIMFAATPAICIILILYRRQTRQMREMLRGLAFAYAGFLVTWLPIYLFMKARHYDYFGVATTVVGTTQTGNLFQRLIGNVQVAVSSEVTYFSLIAFIVIVALAVYLVIRRPRIGLLLIGCTIVSLGGILAFGTKLSGRYMLIHIPPLLLLTSIALGIVAMDLNKRLSAFRPGTGTLIVSAGVALWALIFALPFLGQAWADPSMLSLPAQDRLEYVESDSSGYELKETVSYLQDYAAQHGRKIDAIGLVANCGGLALAMPFGPNVQIECPLLYYTGSGQAQLAALINDRAKVLGSSQSDDLWVIYEALPYATLDGVTAHYEPMVTFQFPGNLIHITLLHVTGP